MNYEAVIGLEVHIQLNTQSKLFATETNTTPDHPNEAISALTLALPGTLPKVNKAAVSKAIKLGISLGCKIQDQCYFDRKSYSYPDLPKGFQTTQDNRPICVGGVFKFWSGGVLKSIRIHHIHLEEDAGKSIHDQDPHHSLIDLNRAGTPLVEMVTEPDFRSAQEVYDFYAAIQKWVQYLEISDANMEKGNLRCDCNVSIRPKDSDILGERCEIKNVNSKKFAKDAIALEIKRQEQLLAEGKAVPKSSLKYDPVAKTIQPMRSKENVKDYLYFPEPDIPPITISQEWINEVGESIDWTPLSLTDELAKYQLKPQELEVLTDEKAYGLYYLALVDHGADPHGLKDLLIQKVIPELKQNNQIEVNYNEKHIIEFCNMLRSPNYSKSALLQDVYPRLAELSSEDTIESLADDLGLRQEEDQSFVDELIAQVFDAYPDKVTAYKSGKKGLLGFFMGQVKRSAGNAVNPQVLQQKIKDLLG